MKLRYLIILLAAFVLVSCGSARYYGGANPSMIQDMILLGPVSTQYYIDRDNQELFSDSLSVVSEGTVRRLAEEMVLPLTRTVPLDSIQKEEAVAYMRFLADLDSPGRGSAPIPILLDELLEANGHRYGLLIYANGLTRDSKGIAKSVAKDLLLGVSAVFASGGSVAAEGGAIIFASELSAAILDSETDRVVFFNNHTPADATAHPFREKDVRRQIKAVLKDFLKE